MKLIVDVNVFFHKLRQVFLEQLRQKLEKSFFLQCARHLRMEKGPPMRKTSAYGERSKIARYNDQPKHD